MRLCAVCSVKFPAFISPLILHSLMKFLFLLFINKPIIFFLNQWKDVHDHSFDFLKPDTLLEEQQMKWALFGFWVSANGFLGILCSFWNLTIIFNPKELQHLVRNRFTNFSQCREQIKLYGLCSSSSHKFLCSLEKDRWCCLMWTSDSESPGVIGYFLKFFKKDIFNLLSSRKHIFRI